MTESPQVLEERSRLASCLRPAASAVVARAVNAMTIDVEDYFHVAALSSRIDRSEWDSQTARVERNTEHVLELLAEHDARATFFVLGWVATRYPRLVARMAAGGHELASHGFSHIRVDEQTPGAFRADVRRTKHLLEDLGGAQVLGYRAANFSISEKTPWAFEVLGEEGYAYSSSIYPIRHDHYGAPQAPRFAHRPTRGGVLEVPITTIRLFRRNLPCGGGGYFRLLPYPISRWAMRRVNRAEGRPCVFYFHPWEIDPEQPRIAGLPLRSHLRHYTNLGRMKTRLHAVLRDFTWDRIDRVFLAVS